VRLTGILLEKWGYISPPWMAACWFCGRHFGKQLHDAKLRPFTANWVCFEECREATRCRYASCPRMVLKPKRDLSAPFCSVDCGVKGFTESLDGLRDMRAVMRRL
jgi:hypothetical protein